MALRAFDQHALHSIMESNQSNQIKSKYLLACQKIFSLQANWGHKINIHSIEFLSLNAMHLSDAPLKLSFAELYNLMP